MPVINANCPIDQAKLAVLYQDKNDWFEAHKLAVETSPGKRLSALDSLGAEKGYTYRRMIVDRADTIKANRKLRAQERLDAAPERYRKIDFLMAELEG